MPLVKVLRHGQITLPKEFRELLGIKAGDIIEVKLSQSTVILKPKALIDKGSLSSREDAAKIENA